MLFFKLKDILAPRNHPSTDDVFKSSENCSLSRNCNKKIPSMPEAENVCTISRGIRDQRRKTLMNAPTLLNSEHQECFVNFKKDLKLIKKYTSENTTFKGSFGNIYRGSYLTGGDCLIETVPVSRPKKILYRAQFESCVKRLHKTALELNKIKHDHIALFYGAFPEKREEAFHDGKVSMGYVYQFCSVKNYNLFETILTLQNAIEMKMNLNEQKIASMICEGMSYLHTKTKITHQDLRARNILLVGTLQSFKIKIAEYNTMGITPLVYDNSVQYFTKKNTVRLSYDLLNHRKYRENVFTDFSISIIFFLIFLNVSPRLMRQIYRKDIHKKNFDGQNYSNFLSAELDFSYEDDIFSFGTLLFVLHSAKLPYGKPLLGYQVKMLRLALAEVQKVEKSPKFSSSAISSTSSCSDSSFQDLIRKNESEIAPDENRAFYYNSKVKSSPEMIIWNRIYRVYFFNCT